MLDVFAITAPGLEALCAAELSSLGIRGTVVDGGVAWSGSIETVARANLWLRTASRVVVRVAEFKAKAFFELELHAKKIEWARWIAREGAVEFRVTCRKSKLYHSDAVAERFAQAVTRRVRSAQIVSGKKSDEDDDKSKPSTPASLPQLFIVRFLHDVCTVSVD
ncbi:MAG: THUMP domain-containing class I SAM-dependent RNA methyltransferase, partial [bacterium]